MAKSDDKTGTEANRTKRGKERQEDKTVFDEFLPYLFTRITYHLNQELLRDLQKHNINISRWRVLAVLSINDGLTISQMANAAMMEQSALSRTIIKMEEEKLIKRTLYEADNRYVLVNLTKAGRALFDALHPVVRRRQELCIKNMSPRDVEQLISLVKRVKQNLQDE